MTYCVGLKLDRGLVFMSDTRTNAGVDNISVFRKMFHWEAEGERSITLMTAGNLATTQAVVSLLHERALPAEERGSPSIMEAPSMFQVARLVGETLREVIQDQKQENGQTGEAFSATLIVGGQVRGGDPHLFLIYPEGNFVEASPDTPFFQIGEHKYGKPILDRVITVDTSLEDAKTAALLSMDSTLRSNLGVGMPLDLAVMPTGLIGLSENRRIEPEDQAFREFSEQWSTQLREAFGVMRTMKV